MNHQKVVVALIVAIGFTPVFSQKWKPQFKENIPFDSIRLSDPCILADKKSSTYYMMFRTFEGKLLMGTSKNLFRHESE